MNDCTFCKIIAGEIPSRKVYEDDQVYAFLDIHPASPYHTLIIPKTHSVNMFDVDAADLQAVMAVVKKLVDLYHEKLGIENVQILNSSGKDAQQDVFHLHYHIVPRQADDGQDIHWTKTDPTPEQLDEMLSKIKN